MAASRSRPLNRSEAYVNRGAGRTRTLREHGEGRVEWLRHTEWTIGGRPGLPGDGRGHPHLHIWFFAPFLPHLAEDDRVTEWWREALVRVGFAQRDALDRLVIDLRPVRNGKVGEGGGIVTEVIKYMTKDIIKPGIYVAPEVYARVYEELDGRRPLQASRGFMALGKEEVCCVECGAKKSCLVRLRREGEVYGRWMGSIEAYRAHALAQGPPPIAAPATGAPSNDANVELGLRVDETPLGRAMRPAQCTVPRSRGGT
jgi:hypothetical protein